MRNNLFIAEETEWLRRGLEMPSVAFGDSMLPLLKPLSEIRIRPTPLDQIRKGDLVAFRLNGHLCVHRALKGIRRPEGMFWLTKGDNRFQCDPPFGPQQVVGVVVRVGSSDLTTRSWRVMNRAMALISYYPLAVSLRAISWLPRGKRLATRWAAAFQPLLLLNRFLGRYRRSKTFVRELRLRSRGLEVRNYRSEDTSALVDLWNRCFPEEPTDLAHFVAKIQQSPWFSPEGCFLAIRESRLIGFALASERRYPQEGNPRSRTGFIECLGVDPPERRRGMGSLLLDRAMGALRSSGCHAFQTGRFRISSQEGGSGFLLGPSLSFFGKLGFEIAAIGREFGTVPDRWDRTISQRWRVRLREHGMQVRAAEPADRPRFESAVRKWGHPNWARFRTDGNGGHPDALLLALHENRAVGCCRSSVPEEVRSYDEIEWVWAATSLEGFGYLHGLYVEPPYRRFGLGAALVATAGDALFDRGCRDVRGWVPLAALQARYRRWGLRSLGAVVSMLKKEG